MTDFGLYGPGSVTWKVHEEPILFVAGLRALILQSLHPRAIAGVAQNSDYKTRPAHRLEQTSNYVITMNYGTTPEAERAAARVRGIHSRLRGHDLFTGDEFRLDEPELLRWVHVTEVESFLTVARRAGLRLTDEEADAYFLEQRRGAALVGLDPETVPGSVAEVERYYADMQPRLAMTKEAADTLFFLTVPPMPFGLGWTPVRGMYLGIAALAIGLLPAWARRFYGLPGIEAADPAATLTARALRLSLLPLPWDLVRTPVYKAAMKRAADAGTAA